MALNTPHNVTLTEGQIGVILCSLEKSVKYADSEYIEEDYDMGEYDCLCEICFDINNSEGKIKWKDDKNPFVCK